MGLEAFPEIENFQNLPHQLIVKGGAISYSEDTGSELRGIVINNLGQSVSEIRVNLVVFDENKIPKLSTHVEPDPSRLAQGGIANFIFRLQDLEEKLEDYHLFVDWKRDD